MGYLASLVLTASQPPVSSNPNAFFDLIVDKLSDGKPVSFLAIGSFLNQNRNRPAVRKRSFSGVTMSGPNGDRNLFVGIMALQLSMITDRQLLDAMKAWAFEKDRQLEDILVGQGAIDENARAILVSLLASKQSNLISQAREESELQSFSTVQAALPRLSEFHDSDPGNDCAAMNLGFALHQQKKYDEAIAWHERAANSSKCKALGNFNLSCWYCLKGDSEKAIDYLETAIQSGLARCLNVECLEMDPDLDGIRHNPRYAAAVKQMGEWQFRPVNSLEPVTQSKLGPMYWAMGTNAR